MADFLGVTVKTVQRWEREGRLIPAGRTPTNRRYYLLEQVLAFQGRKPAASVQRVVAYCRVSSQGQKPELANQRRVLKEFCAARGLANVEFVEEVGGGLNFQRTRFLALMDEISLGRIEALVLAHRDRLTRFGFEWFEHYTKRHGCELLVLNQEWSVRRALGAGQWVTCRSAPGHRNRRFTTRVFHKPESGVGW